MKKNSLQFDDHHCSIIEKKRMEVELAQCDVTFNSKSERHQCYESIKTTSQKREQACKYS